LRSLFTPKPVRLTSKKSDFLFRDIPAINLNTTKLVRFKMMVVDFHLIF